MSGGGGHPMPLRVSRGNPPKLALKPALLVTEAPKIASKLTLQPTLDIQPDVKMAKADLPNIGMSNSPVVVASMGNNSGAGLGSGNGNGLGSGAGGNFGGGVLKVGGGVSQPQVLFAPDPAFTEEARQLRRLARLSSIYKSTRKGIRCMYMLCGVWEWDWMRRRSKRSVSTSSNRR